MTWFENLSLFLVAIQQVFIVTWKNFKQKQRVGRSTLKELFFIPGAVCGFVIYLFVIINTSGFADSIYARRGLSPFNDNGMYGVFNPSASFNKGPTGPVTEKNIYYFPNNHTGVNELMASLGSTYPDLHIHGVSDLSDLVDNYQSNIFSTLYGIGFYLNAEQYSTGKFITAPQGNIINYVLRVNPMAADLPTYEFDDQVYNNAGSNADAWVNSGYLTLQNFIRTYITNQYDGVTDFEVDTTVQRYPSSPVYDNDPNFNSAYTRFLIWKWIASPVWTIVLILPVLGVFAQAVKENEMRMKDILEISGLLPVSYWLGYEVTCVVLGQITMWMMLAVLYGGGIITSYSFLPYAGLLTCFQLFMSSYSMAFGFVVPKSEYYGLPVYVLNLILSVGGDFVAHSTTLPIGVKLLLSFFMPSTGLTIGIFAIETYQYNNQNTNINLNYVDSSKNFPSILQVEAVLIVAAVFYLFICWGMPFTWLFQSSDKDDLVNLALANEDFSFPDDIEDCKNSDDKFCRSNSLLVVQGLSHVYPDGTHAVKKMSFEVREGEVLSFLGANGAGKSTTMGMLCGTLSPTAGDAKINGHSIVDKKSQARRNLGICSQQDIIWDDISVEEHLYMFGRLRGSSGNELKSSVTKMLDDLGFPEKARSLAGTLSGGQKRRLCAGISMIGGNSVVYLDEPTAGLDPVSRRQLWELVEKNRNGRAILLTTHFMDEADVLGDRIAIVKEGRLRCVGTSKFLKSKFGVGYLLRCSMSTSFKHPFDSDRLLSSLSEFVADISIASQAGSELCFRVPKEASIIFPKMFEFLENRGVEFNMTTFGIETTTLEEVFMRIVNEDEEELLLHHEKANKLLGASIQERDSQEKYLREREDARNPLTDIQLNLLLTKGNSASSLAFSSALFFYHVAIMLSKRFYQFFRSKGQFIMGFVLPLAFTILMCILIETMPTDILGDNPAAVMLDYVPFAPALVASPSKSDADSFMNAAFTSPSYDYVGKNYSYLYDVISADAQGGMGPISSEGIAFLYDRPNNFTVLYNASFPMNFVSAVSDLLNGAISNVTGNGLKFIEQCQPYPTNLFNLQSNDAFFIAMLMSVFAGAVGSGISIVLGGERISGVKHQQLSSGASKMAYWVANFIWDISILMFNILVLAVALAITRPTDFAGNGFGVVLTAGICFSMAEIARFHVASFVIGDVKLAQSLYFYGSLLLMYINTALWFNIVFISDQGDASGTAGSIMTCICTVIDPAFGFMLTVLFQHNFLAVKTLNNNQSVLSTAIAGNILYVQLGMFGLFLILLILVDFQADIKGLFGGMGGSKPVHIDNSSSININNIEEGAGSLVVSNNINPLTIVRSSFTAEGRDPDVVAERLVVNEVMSHNVINPSRNAIIVHKLKKVYFGKGTIPTKVAVKSVSFTIPHGEIFGLLGANGAGKSTLLKMISGLEDPTEGRGIINGFDVVKNRGRAQMSMGMCPQFDTLVERLSVRENLVFFGRVKGVPESCIDDVCNTFMKVLKIDRYQHKLIQHLSGGNRRKVSLAVALLGSPPVIYLDEPSTGLDPVASRLMWRLLNRFAAARCSALILTTHNMLECEAVCTRIGIMKMGELVCMGNSQHLRSVHGTGFLLEITVESIEHLEKAKRFVMESFSSCVIVDEHATMVNFEISRDSISKLSETFRLLESKKDECHIVDYSLSQSTLEQVFLKQIRPADPEARAAEDKSVVYTEPSIGDYFLGYLFLFLAIFLPGYHHFALRNYYRGWKYLLTINEVYCGWVLDIFEMHVLVQKSVREHGHLPLFPCVECCGCCCCCCACMKKKIANDPENDD